MNSTGNLYIQITFYFLIYNLRIKWYLSEFLCRLKEQTLGRGLVGYLMQGKVCCWTIFWDVAMQTWVFLGAAQLKVQEDASGQLFQGQTKVRGLFKSDS